MIRHLLLLALLILPAWITLRARNLTLGYVAGAALFWLLLVLMTTWQLKTDPTFGGPGAGFALVFGWVAGGGYGFLCLVLRGLGRIFFATVPETPQPSE